MINYDSLIEIKSNTLNDIIVPIEVIFECMRFFLLKYGFSNNVKIVPIDFEQYFLSKNDITKNGVSILYDETDYNGIPWGYIILTMKKRGNTRFILYKSGKSELESLRESNRGNNIYTRFPVYIRNWEKEKQFRGAVEECYDKLFNVKELSKAAYFLLDEEEKNDL